MSILGAAIYAASVLGGCSPGGNATPSGTGGALATGGASSGGNIASGGTTPVTGGSGGGGAVNTGGAGVSSGGSVATGGALTGGSSGAAAGGSSGSAAGGVSTGAGAGGGAAGAGGSGGVVELKMPIERSGKYVLEFGSVLFEVDPAVGGRVVTFSLSGQNLLTNAAADNTKSGNYGSTFWPSPQMWGGSDWPPIPEVDSQAYAPGLDGNSIVMTQQSASARGKVSVKKRFTAVLNAQAVDVEYTLTNKDTAAASWAPWEISRVALSGLTFFPSGSSVVSIPSDKALPTARVTTSGGVSWYKNAPADRGKYSADGAEGWLAQVSGDLLFVKRFADVPAAQAAPSEGDAEFYAGDGYEEIEAQGAYQSLQAGASLTWTVRWYVRQLSDPSIATVGNAALVTMARDIVKQ